MAAAKLAELTANAGTDAVEVAASAGTVIFFHGRLAHAAGVNTISGTCRIAAFCDFQKARPIVDIPPIDGTSFRRLWAEERWDTFQFRFISRRPGLTRVWEQVGAGAATRAQPALGGHAGEAG